MFEEFIEKKGIADDDAFVGAAAGGKPSVVPPPKIDHMVVCLPTMPGNSLTNTLQITIVLYDRYPGKHSV